MGDLVEQLLALSELEAQGRADLAREPVDLHAVATHVAGTVAARASRRQIGIRVAIAPGLAALADHDGVERALQNLVENAIKYGKDEGSVTVTASRQAAAGERPSVTLTVADDGEGIEAQHLPRLFERFYRVDAGRSREHGGAGLGLAIVKHLVESMDGSIAVASEPGKGTTFTVTLPAAVSSA
jgi:two-component system phosphate regulon sensor histidine kinase PhoR